MAIPDKELSEKLDALLIKMLIVGLVGILLIVVLIMLFSRNIVMHTRRMDAMANHLAEGDFTYTLPVATQDEFGRTAEKLNHTTVMLKGMLTEVTGHTLRAAATSKQLSVSAEET